MKNIKNTVAAMGLMAVLGLGAVSANAGMLVSDRGVGSSCETSGGIFNQMLGILIVGVNTTVGGILMSDRSGMLVSDRPGMLVSDRGTGCQQSRDGILMSD